MKPLLLLLLSFFLHSMNIMGQWQQVNGPHGQHITCIASDNSIIAAGTLSDGVFISQDTGKNWVRKTQDVNMLRIKTLALHDSYIFAGTLFEGIYRSSDLGETWEELDLQENVEGVTSILMDNNTIYIGTNGKGIFKSENNGTSWQKINNGLQNLYVNSIIKVQDKLFAGTWGGVFVSTNHGGLWSAVNSGLDVSGVQALIYKGDSLIVSGVNDDGVFYSQNFGSSWQSMNNGLLNKSIRDFAILENKIYAGTNDGIFIYENNNFNWQKIGSDLTGTNVFSIISVDDLLFVGTSDGGINKSENKGVSWSAANAGMADIYVEAITFSQDKLFVGSINGIIYTIFDKGKSCHELNISESNIEIQSIITTENKIFAAGNGAMYMSGDLGNNWEKLNNSFWLNNPILKKRADNIYYAGFGLGGLFFSDNYGNSWQDIRPFPESQIVSSLTMDDNKLYAGGYGAVYSSIDNGTSWQKNNGNILANYDIIALLVDGNNLYAGTATFANGVFISRDQGQNWFGSKLGLPNICSITDFALYNDVLFLATGCNGVYYSLNRGINWNSLRDGLGDLNITGLAITDDEIYAGTESKGVWKHSISGISTNVDVETIENEIIVYPNPASQSLHIVGGITGQVDIFDVTGHLLKRYPNENINHIEIDISEISSGLYFLKLQTKDGIQTKRFYKL